jgi:hypothetical protein
MPSINTVEPIQLIVPKKCKRQKQEENGYGSAILFRTENDGCVGHKHKEVDNSLLDPFMTLRYQRAINGNITSIARTIVVIESSPTKL